MAKAPDFKYAPMFQVGADKTEYRLLTKEGVSTAEFEGKTILKVSKEALTLLAQQGYATTRTVTAHLMWTSQQTTASKTSFSKRTRNLARRSRRNTRKI